MAKGNLRSTQRCLPSHSQSTHREISKHRWLAMNGNGIMVKHAQESNIKMNSGTFHYCRGMVAEINILLRSNSIKSRFDEGGGMPYCILSITLLMASTLLIWWQEIYTGNDGRWSKEILLVCSDAYLATKGSWRYKGATYDNGKGIIVRRDWFKVRSAARIWSQTDKWRTLL